MYENSACISSHMVYSLHDISSPGVDLVTGRFSTILDIDCIQQKYIVPESWVDDINYQSIVIITKLTHIVTFMLNFFYKLMNIKLVAMT